ncbi:MAG: type VI secretion system tip protein TssI/VgrG [Byssovorax sp.]
MTFAKLPGKDPVAAAAEGAAEAAVEGELEKAAGAKLEKVAAAVGKVTHGIEAAEAAAGGAGKQVMSLLEGQAGPSLGESIPGFAGGSIPAGGGLVSGGFGSGVIGEASAPELPFFEEKAITSLSSSPLGAAMGKAGATLGGLAGGLLSRLHGKNLAVHVASGDALDVRSFSIEERMSSLFEVTLIVVSENHSVEFDAVVGQPARFDLHGGHHDRVWSGLCNHFAQVKVEPSGLSTYELTIVPELWLLTQRKNYRIFQQMSEPDIALKLLDEWGIKPELRIDRGAYKKRKYRVQYAEPDYAFLSRMLEDAGITFYFEQQGEESKLVLADAPHLGHKRALPLSFQDDVSAAHRSGGEFATNVRMGQKVRPGKVTLRDHDYRRAPSYKLMTSAAGGLPVEGKLEQFHYTPGAFLFGSDQGEATPAADDKGKVRTDEKEGALLAQKRLDAKRGSARVCTFETNAYDLCPGVVLSLAGHPHGALGDSKKLLVTSATMHGTDTGDWSLRCEARGTEVPYRPDHVTPRPTVNGVESATVVGPKGEEIHTDEFGRVRVHFHWDRESQMDDNSSCWIHVSQPWGGSGYGGMNLPRIGQEVLVDFLGGDPDRPVIVGRMYTNLQKVPYKLPQNKTQSGWRSNSTGGGGGYNEIMFEDAAGKELVNIQAQKDLTETVKHDETTTVWNNSTNVVGTAYSLTIGEPKLGQSPGTFPPSPGQTSVSMSNDSITQKTSNASISWTAEDISIHAANSISLSANGASIHIGGKEKTITINADTLVAVHAKKTVKVDGDQYVYINCTKPPPSEMKKSGTSLLEKAATFGGIGSMVAMAAGFPVLGAALLGVAIVGQIGQALSH